MQNPDHAVHFVHPVYTRENAKYFVRGNPRPYVESDMHPKGEWDTSFLAVGRSIPLAELTQFDWVPDPHPIDKPNRHRIYLGGLVFRIPSGQLIFGGLDYLDPEERLYYKLCEAEPFVEELYEPGGVVTLEIRPGYRDIQGKPVEFDFNGVEGGLIFSIKCPMVSRWDGHDILFESCNPEVNFANHPDTLKLYGHGPWWSAFELVGFVVATDKKIQQAPTLEDWDDELPEQP